MNKIGIIQGRLSLPIDGKIQAFPRDTWQEEFEKAKEVGLDSIEFIFEEENYHNNPLLTDSGRQEIRSLIKRTGVSVDHILADFFMQRPLIRVSRKEQQESVEVLKKLITAASELGVIGIEIPLVDNSEIKTEEEMKTIINSVKEVLPLARKYTIEIGFETSLPPGSFLDFLSSFDNPLNKANYDTGNSACLGYDTDKEIAAYGKFISNVHIKDRLLGGSTVPLGAGNADFDKTFRALSKMHYHGPFILQVARGEDGKEIDTARHNLAYVKNLVSRHLNY